MQCRVMKETQRLQAEKAAMSKLKTLFLGVQLKSTRDLGLSRLNLANGRRRLAIWPITDIKTTSPSLREQM